MKKQKEQNVEILTPDEISGVKKTSGNIIIGTLNVFAAPIKKRHEKHYKQSRFHLIADIVLAFVIIGLIISLWWVKNLQPREDVFLENKISTENVLSGQRASFEIVYKNKLEQKLSDANIVINFPDHFVLKNISPENNFDEKNHTFKIGELNSQADGSMKIEGVVFGEVDKEQKISYSFNYEVNGEKKNALGVFDYIITGSALDLSLSFPEQVYKNVEFPAQMVLTNNGNEKLEDIDLSIKGGNFSFKGVSCDQCQVTVKNGDFKVKEIKSGEKVVVDFFAATTAGEGENLFEVQGFVNKNKESLKQKVVQKNILIQSPKFKVTLSADKEVIKSGEVVNFTMNYNNQEVEEIKNIKISFRGRDGMEINSLKLNDAYAKKENNTLFLGNAAAGKKDALNLEVSFKRVLAKTEQTSGLIGTVSYQLNGQNIYYDIFSPKIKVLADVKIKSGGYYYSPQGDQLGIGPLPPEEGIPTTYWIFWEIYHEGGNLKDLQITAQLPENVIWTDNKSLLAGKLQFGNVGRRIVWAVPEIGDENKIYKAGFEVKIIPEKTDIGKTMQLLSDIEYTAYDTFCDQAISGKLEGINTDLKNDLLAKNKGKVGGLDK